MELLMATFERVFAFLRNTINAPVTVQVDDEEALVGSILNVKVGNGVQLLRDTSDRSVTTWELRAPSGNILGAWDLSEGSSTGGLAAFDLDEGSSTTTYSASTVDLDAGASA